jgi:hypothetical protein
MPKDNKQKQADFKARQIKAGFKRKEYWATEEQHHKLRRYLEELKIT